VSKVIVGRGKGRAFVEGPDAQELEAIIHEALGEAVGLLDDQVEEVFTNLKKTWPVFKGKSLASWHKVKVIDPTNQTVRISLVNPLDYVFLIDSGKTGKTRSGKYRMPFHTDLRIPMKERSESIRPALKQALMDALKRTFNG